MTIHPVGVERRVVQRISFDKPLGGSVATGPVRIADLSVTGARCVHLFPFTPGDLVRVSFQWQEERFSLSCRVIHCAIKGEPDHGPMIFQSGLRFTSQFEVKASGLIDLLSDFVVRVQRRSRTKPSGPSGSRNEN